MDKRQSERREVFTLTDEELDKIAERAVDHAFKRLQQEVGAAILKRVFLYVGAAFLAFVYWYHAKFG